jgi:hypothetical protein
LNIDADACDSGRRHVVGDQQSRPGDHGRQDGPDHDHAASAWLQVTQPLVRHQGYFVSPGALLDIDKLQPESTHPVQNSVQIILVEITGQDGGRGLDLDRHVIESLTGGRAERSHYPDLVGDSGHRAPFLRSVASLRRALPRTADPPDVHQLEAQRPDPLEQAMQSGLVEVTGDDGERTANGYVHGAEGRRGCLVELPGDSDLVACEHETVLTISGYCSRLLWLAAGFIMRRE